MNPHRLWARNLRTWPALDVVIPEGVTAVLGENGAGKSTLVNVLDLALFGTGRELNRALTRGGGEEECEVGCKYEHAGRLYRVRRVAGPKPRLDYERIAGMGWTADTPAPLAEELRRTDTWEPLTRETMAQTQALIEEHLGLTRDTFRASAFLAQGDGAAFTDAAPRERKAMLMQVLDPRGLWAALEARARAEASAAASGESAAEGAYASARARAESLTGSAVRLVAAQAEEEVARQAHEEAQRAATAAREHEHELRGTEERRVAAAREVQRHRAAAELQEAHLAAAAERLALLARREPELDTLELAAALAPAVEEYLALCRRRDAASAEADRAARLRDQRSAETDECVEECARLEAALLTYAADDASCLTCGQPLKGEAEERAIAAAREALTAAERLRDTRLAQAQEADREVSAREAEVHAADVALPAAYRETAACEQALRDCRDAATAAAALRTALEERERIGAARAEHERLRLEAAAALTAAEAALDALPSAAGLGAASAERERAEAEERAAFTRLNDGTAARARAATDAGHLAAAEEEAAVQAALRDAASEEAATCTALARAYGRDGIPALLMENTALPHLEAEANRLLGEFGRSYRLELRTQRATGSGTIQEALDIVLHAEGGEALYEDFSGGERTRIDLALRIALARLLAARRGADCRVLVVDEPAFLDEPGFARLAHVLQGLRSEFARVLVVSHHSALRDAFDGVLEVQGGGDTGEPSRLAREEVLV